MVIMMQALAATAVAAMLQSPAAPPPADAALRVFAEHVDREWPGEAAQQALTVRSLTLLADAVESLAARRGLAAETASRLPDVRDDIRKYAAGTPGDVRQARQLRRTLKGASDLIRRLVAAADKSRERDARLNALDRAAKAIDDDQVLRRQPDAIERFFHHAAESLRRLDTPS